MTGIYNRGYFGGYRAGNRPGSGGPNNGGGRGNGGGNGNNNNGGRGGGRNGYAFNGVLVRASADITPATEYLWDTEVYDAGGWHDTGSNTGRMVVPLGVSLVRAIGNSKINASSGISEVKHMLGGSDFAGQSYSAAEATGILGTLNGASAVIAVSAGQYFTMHNTLSTTVDGSEETWFAVEAIDPVSKYALLTKSATQAISADTPTILTWQTEVADVGGWFDSGVSNQNFVVPAGVSYVRFSANSQPNNSTGQNYIEVQTGAGATFPGMGCKDTQRSGTDFNGFTSAVVAVNPGDTFRLSYLSESATTVQNTNATWFAVEEVRGFSGCLAYKSATQGISAGVEAAVAFAAEAYDTHSAHDNASNNSRITVPSGFTKARPSFSVEGPPVAQYFRGRVMKNGAVYNGMPSFANTTTNADFCSGIGAWVDVNPGDYFELFVTSGSGGTMPISHRTWLCVEFR